MFFIALILLRAAGARVFSRKSAFDQVIAIMLGAVLSRGITGASPFGQTVVAGIVMMFIYRLTGWLSERNNGFERIVKGDPVLLYKDGNFNRKKMQQCMITEEDIKESVRLELQEPDLRNVAEVLLEINGRLSFVKRKGE